MKLILALVTACSLLSACGQSLTDQERVVLQKADAPNKISDFQYAQDRRTGLCFFVSPKFSNGHLQYFWSATNVPCTPEVLKEIQQP